MHFKDHVEQQIKYIAHRLLQLKLAATDSDIRNFAENHVIRNQPLKDSSDTRYDNSLRRAVYTPTYF